MLRFESGPCNNYAFLSHFDAKLHFFKAEINVNWHYLKFEIPPSRLHNPVPIWRLACMIMVSLNLRRPPCSLIEQPRIDSYEYV